MNALPDAVSDTAPVWMMGCGDVGRRLVNVYPTGHTLSGWVSSAESVRHGAALGIQLLQGDMDKPCDYPVAAMQGAAVYWLAPPPPSGQQDTRLRAFLEQAKAAPGRIVLISTTGVYGDCEGRWIDESEPLKPAAERAIRRCDAEQALQAWGERYQRDWVILRVPGIYALSRLPLKRLQQQLPVLTLETSPWTNRIHADDLAMVCKKAMYTPRARQRIYNATDGKPLRMTAYFNRIAEFYGLPAPPQISFQEAQTQLSSGMLSYLRESRRIDNQRLVQDLRVTLRYPDLESALVSGD